MSTTTKSETKANLVEGTVIVEEMKHNGKLLKRDDKFKATEAQLKIYRSHNFVKGE